MAEPEEELPVALAAGAVAEGVETCRWREAGVLADLPGMVVLVVPAVALVVPAVEGAEAGPAPALATGTPLVAGTLPVAGTPARPRGRVVLVVIPDLVEVRSAGTAPVVPVPAGDGVVVADAAGFRSGSGVAAALGPRGSGGRRTRPGKSCPKPGRDSRGAHGGRARLRATTST